LDKPPEDWDGLPASWQSALAAQLEPGEAVLATFQPDLESARLRYAEGLVALTDRRVLHAEGVSPSGREAAANLRWDSWPLEEIASMRARDRAGVGQLELLGHEARLAHWRYTVGRATAAHRLVDTHSAWRRDGRIADLELTACPSCGTTLAPHDKSCPFCNTASTPATASLLRRLFRFASSRAKVISWGVVLTIASTAVGLIGPYFVRPLTRDILSSEFNYVPWYLLGMAASAVLAWLLTWARTYVLSWASERIAADLRNQTYAHLQCLSLEYFGGKRTGDLMARLSSDTDRICNYLSINLLDFATNVLLIGMTSVILLSMDTQLALVTLCPFPVIAWLVYRVRSVLKRGFHRGNQAWAEMTSVLADAIPGIRVVKAFAQEQREITRFRTANDHVLMANDRVNTTWSFFGPLVTLLTQMGLLVVWAFAVWRIYRNPIEIPDKVGVLTVFLAYTSPFYTRLESMSRMVQSTQRAASSAQRLFEILDRVPSVPEPTRPVHLAHVRGEVELRGVGFRYGSRPVLHNVNLTIRPGEMIGLVGPTGAGKSTLVNLICRFYDVCEGEIRVDGVDIRSFPIEEHRHHIGIVLQDPFLFFGTVAENIAYGRPDATRAEIIAAARAARAHEFVLRLPEGYDSIVGERGQALSGGERQRISIARALLIDPPILILDEATSSVDTETEREIQAALDNLTRGRTTIAIAHRLSTLRKADRLVVIERGEIAEVGHHQELLGRRGAYARLHQAQMDLAQGIVAVKSEALQDGTGWTPEGSVH
jgi:ATP-binding cassette, subfamily B, bacterial